MEIKPFQDGDSYPTLSNIIENVRKEIQSLGDDYVLKASKTELENYYIDKVSIQPLVLHTDKYYIKNQTGTQVDVSNDPLRAVMPGERAFVRGTQLDIAIPFEGEPELWRLKPSSWSLSGYPAVSVHDDHIVLKIIFPDDTVNAKAIRGQIDNKVSSLRSAIDTLRSDIESHNNNAQHIIREILEARISSAKKTSGVISELGIPMKRRDQPLTYTVPTKRRKSPHKPKVSTEPYKREPSLDIDEYEYILNIMRSMSLVIERNPEAFATLNEETIRTHFLLQLNGHYEGSAMGETFNASGKTDILIRVKERNIFIAECKFWRGPKYFNKAIDQLLSYLAWRDSKCALLIFNRTKDTSAVKSKMHEIMQTRPEHQKTLFNNPDGDSRYIFVKESDPGREIIVTTQLYDIPV